MVTIILCWIQLRPGIWKTRSVHHKLKTGLVLEKSIEVKTCSRQIEDTTPVIDKLNTRLFLDKSKAQDLLLANWRQGFLLENWRQVTCFRQIEDTRPFVDKLKLMFSAIWSTQLYSFMTWKFCRKFFCLTKYNSVTVAWRTSGSIQATEHAISNYSVAN
jgi:hypothetical protein